MAAPHTIPSKLNQTATVTAGTGNYLYITAVLAATTLDVDSKGGVVIGPISIESPIRCQTFTVSVGATTGVVAYYEMSH